MPDLIYYQEYTSAARTAGAPLVLAVSPLAEPFMLNSRSHVRALGSLDNVANSDNIHNIDVSEDYLSRFCQRISVKQAYRIHPNLIMYISNHKAS